MILARKTAGAPAPAVPSLMPISEHPEYAAVRDEIEQFYARLRQVEASRDSAVRRARGEKPRRSVVERAADLVRGGSIPLGDPAAEIARADEEAEILQGAIGEMHQRLAEVAGRLSYEASLKLQPAHFAGLRDALAGMAQIDEAIKAMVTIRDALVAGGYTVSSVPLNCPMPPAGYALGSPDSPNTQAGHFRRALEHMKAI